jgi:hypothetical protein
VLPDLCEEPSPEIEEADELEFGFGVLWFRDAVKEH